MADHYGQPGGWGEGDFNGDAFVDGGDYTIWADNYAGLPIPGDANEDGSVDGGDYTL